MSKNRQLEKFLSDFVRNVCKKYISCGILTSTYSKSYYKNKSFCNNNREKQKKKKKEKHEKD